METSISKATIRNWQRLSTEKDTRLKSRANKTLSEKYIVPVEYYQRPKNKYFSSEIVDMMKTEQLTIASVVYQIACELLSNAGILKHQHVKKVLDEFKRNNELSEVTFQVTIPDDERDILGITYQSLLVEGEKNKKGSYYTPENIVEEMTKKIDLKEKAILDPCCGSGSFLLSISCEDPRQLVGFDNDEIAVFITKINLLLKFKNLEFEPQVYVRDFLNDQLSDFANKFDYIITNPPWGALPKGFKNTEINSKETFSHFLVHSKKFLKKNGCLIYLLPESFLNVKTHKDLRLYVLNNYKIKNIHVYDKLFAGVTTKYISIQLELGKQHDLIEVYRGERSWKVLIDAFYQTENYNYNLIAVEDYHLIEKIKEKKNFDLKESEWALGIVTGDNKNKLKNNMASGLEPIYTGKEITAYQLLAPKKFIRYDRENFQQVAKDEIYRAKEKLVYKFISKKLVFAYDKEGSLFLNSANILIPNTKNASIKTIMALLNSTLYAYIYTCLFGEIKILRGNLEELPFPKISTKQDNEISDLVANYLEKQDPMILRKLDKVIYQLFDLTPKEIQLVEKTFA